MNQSGGDVLFHDPFHVVYHKEGEGHWAEMVQGLERAFLGDGDDGGVVPQHGDNGSTQWCGQDQWRW